MRTTPSGSTQPPKIRPPVVAGFCLPASTVTPALPRVPLRWPCSLPPGCPTSSHSWGHGPRQVLRPGTWGKAGSILGRQVCGGGWHWRAETRDAPPHPPLGGAPSGGTWPCMSPGRRRERAGGQVVRPSACRSTWVSACLQCGRGGQGTPGGEPSPTGVSPSPPTASRAPTEPDGRARDGCALPQVRHRVLWVPRSRRLRAQGDREQLTANDVRVPHQTQSFTRLGSHAIHDHVVTSWRHLHPASGGGEATPPGGTADGRQARPSCPSAALRSQGACVRPSGDGGCTRVLSLHREARLPLFAKVVIRRGGRRGHHQSGTPLGAGGGGGGALPETGPAPCSPGFSTAPAGPRRRH